MVKRYICAVDKTTDSLEAAQFTLSHDGRWEKRGVHVIVRQAKAGTTTQATMVLSQEDAIDLATSILAWSVHGVELKGEE
jgi:hypothetical protein